MQYPTDFINKFICGDSLTILKQIPDNSVNTVVTSPPYNLGKLNCHEWNIPNKIDYGNYIDDLPEKEYQEYQKDIIKELVRIIKPNGSIFYNHKPRSRKHKLILPTEWLHGFDIRQIIIWKRNGAVNRQPITFQQNTEWIIWIKKTIPKFDSEYFKCGEVWYIPFAMNTPHPAPFPIEIPLRCIQATTSRGDTVLDPFMGSGTTAIACKRTGRDFIGIDLNPDYIKMAERRLASYTTITQKNNTPLTVV